MAFTASKDRRGIRWRVIGAVFTLQHATHVIGGAIGKLAGVSKLESVYATRCSQ